MRYFGVRGAHRLCNIPHKVRSDVSNYRYLCFKPDSIILARSRVSKTLGLCIVHRRSTYLASLCRRIAKLLQTLVKGLVGAGRVRSSHRRATKQPYVFQNFEYVVLRFFFSDR